MLNRRICERCRAPTSPEFRFSNPPEDWGNNVSNSVACHDFGETAKINAPPPAWCPHALEHMLKEAADVEH